MNLMISTIVAFSSGVTVDHKWSFLLLFAALFVVLFSYLANYRKRMQERFIDKTILSTLVPVRCAKKYWLRTSLLILSWILISLSIMRPRIVKERASESTTSSEAIDTDVFSSSGFSKPNIDSFFFVIDVSQSMTAQDTSDSSSRLNKAKDVIHSVLEAIGGTNASLYVFSDNCILLVPPTLDYLYYRVMLDNVRINEPGIAGTDILNAVIKIRKEFGESPYLKKCSVVILSDGEDTNAQGNSGSYLDSILENVNKTKVEGLSWFSVGIGTKQGAIIPDFQFNGATVTSYANSTLLERIAEAGNGRFYDANTTSSDYIANDILVRSMSYQSHSQNGQKNQKISSTWSMSEQGNDSIELFYYPLSFGIVLLVLAMSLSPFEIRRQHE